MSSYRENPADDEEEWIVIHPNWKSYVVGKQLARALKPISTDSIRIHALGRMTERLPASLVIEDPAQFAEHVITTFDNATGRGNAFFFLARKFTVYQNLQFAVPLRLKLLAIGGGLEEFIYLFGNCQDSAVTIREALGLLPSHQLVVKAIVYMLTTKGGYEKLAELHRGARLLSLLDADDEKTRTTVRNMMSYNFGLRQSLKFMDDHEYPRSYSRFEDSPVDSDDDNNNNNNSSNKKRTREEMEETDQDKLGGEGPVEKKQATESSMDSEEEEEVPEQSSSPGGAMILYTLTLKLGELPSVGDMKKHPEIGDFYWRVLEKIRGQSYTVREQKVYLMNKTKYDTNRTRAGGITKSYFVLPLTDDLPEDALLDMFKGVFQGEISRSAEGWADQFKIPRSMVSLEGTLSARTLGKSVFKQTVRLG